jgi:hypothetical protein
MACDCVNITLTIEKYQIDINGEQYGNQTAQLIPKGRLNGANWYLLSLNNLVTSNTDLFTIWYDQLNDFWKVESGSLPNNGGTIHVQWATPIASEVSGNISAGQWQSLSVKFTQFISFYSIPQTYINNLNISGTYGGYNYYQWNIEGVDFFLYYNDPNNQWEIGWILGGSGGQSFGAVKNSLPPCPPFAVSPVWILGQGFSYIETKECDTYLTNCLSIQYIIPGSQESNTIDINIYQIDPISGAPTYIFEVPEYPGILFQISVYNWGAPFGTGWTLLIPGSQGDLVSFLENDGSFVEAPYSNLPNVFGWSQNSYFDTFNTSEAKECPIIPSDCDCGIRFIFTGDFEYTIESQVSGLYNGRNYYLLSFPFDPNFILYCFWDGDYAWRISANLGDPGLAVLSKNSLCPIGDLSPLDPDPPIYFESWFISGDNYLKTEGIDCTLCGIEDRIYKEYDSIKLPDNFQEQNRGIKDCCCENIVLGSNSSNTWENDKTSAWIKLNIGGTAQFKLYKNGSETNFTPTPQLFINEPNAIFTTINWNDVLISDGEGCYKLVIEYNISGIIGFIDWGIYNLLAYSIQNAKNTARVRAIFDGYHEIEGINFSGSNIESTHRFYGYIGNRQPNMEIDNIIYQNREMKRVIRENLNQYEIITDPIEECQLKPLVDLYLLSENELFISDYNAHNHSYRYNDIPVILEESPEIEYYDFSRKAKLTAKVGDKFKNKRTYYI